MKKSTILKAITLTALLSSSSSAPMSSVDLVSLSIEELMEVKVELTSRTARSMFETPSAVSVLTGTDLRRSGATSLPDALRLVPGMQVGHIDANKWAVSARGFADRFTNKILVLIDGRSVYSPIFSGVFWEARDVLLEDVDRIEVVRGPGATLWGANAVNGIVNIVTTDAGDSRGSLLHLGVGSTETARGAVRHAGRLGEHAAYRVYAKGFDRDTFDESAGVDAADGWVVRRGGFRADWHRGRDVVAVAAGLFGGDAGQTFRFPTLEPPYSDRIDDDTRLAGGHLLARWHRDLSARSDIQLQAYYDRNERDDVSFAADTDAFDVDFQHHLNVGTDHLLGWGLGYRLDRDHTRGSAKIAFDPPSRSTHLWSGFVHDEISLSQRFTLSAGVKAEHNGYSGMELQPSVRAMWLPSYGHTLWGAVSRPVRTPARNDQDVRIAFRTLPLPDPDAAPVLTRLQGERSFDSEHLLAYEAGYRVQALDGLLFDLAAFYNDYSRLRATLAEIEITGEEQPVIEIIFPDANLMEATTFGGELAAEWQSYGGRRRLRGSYSYLHTDFEIPPQSNRESANAESVAPEHQLTLWASVDLPHRVELDVVGRYVGALREHGEPDPVTEPFLPDRNIDAYGELDVRLGWHASASLEFHVAGRNLLSARHPEFAGFFLDTLPTQVPRSVRLGCTWRP